MQITFTSPINRDDGEKHWFVGHAKSTIEANLSDRMGRLDWNYTFIDGANKGTSEHFEITLWFDHNKRLIDFSGVHELPEEAIRMLEQAGYNCEYAKN